MARNKQPENVQSREATTKPVVNTKPTSEEEPKAIGPGWTIAIGVWLVMFAILLVYEGWGFFGGMLRTK